MPHIEEQIASCVDAVRQSDGLLITAGAGLGVDSGLPDFRGSGGFWKAYPALAPVSRGMHDSPGASMAIA